MRRQRQWKSLSSRGVSRKRQMRTGWPKPLRIWGCFAPRSILLFSEKTKLFQVEMPAPTRWTSPPNCSPVGNDDTIFDEFLGLFPRNGTTYWDTESCYQIRFAIFLRRLMCHLSTSNVTGQMRLRVSTGTCVIECSQFFFKFCPHL